jgi:hypothetical protein
MEAKARKGESLGSDAGLTLDSNGSTCFTRGTAKTRTEDDDTVCFGVLSEKQLPGIGFTTTRYDEEVNF